MGPLQGRRDFRADGQNEKFSSTANHHSRNVINKHTFGHWKMSGGRGGLETSLISTLLALGKCRGGEGVWLYTQQGQKIFTLDKWTVEKNVVNAFANRCTRLYTRQYLQITCHPGASPGHYGHQLLRHIASHAEALAADEVREIYRKPSSSN